MERRTPVRARVLAAIVIMLSVLVPSALALGGTAQAASTRATSHVRSAHVALAAKTTPTPTPTFPATGYFSTGQADGRWYLVTPQGQPFYSDGVSHVSIQGDTDIINNTCPYCVTEKADYPNAQTWDTTQISRLRSWGFNTLGPYSDNSTLGSQMPYTVELSMASGNDWFASSFVTHAQLVAQAQAAPLANDPNVIGYFTDSELPWGPPGLDLGDQLTEYLNLPPGSPGLAVAQQYVGNPAGFLYALATRYFSVTSAALKQADPHHLNLGVKAEGQEIQPELLEAARPYVDVFSLEDYQLTAGFAPEILKVWPFYLPVQPNLAAMEQYVQKPLMLGEYTELGADTPDPNTFPGIYAVFPTQQARAAAYENFIAPLYEDAPWVVGDQWFEYIDEPANGRVPNGENDNFGVLNIQDQPYVPMVSAMSAMHSIAPDRLVTSGPTCDSWANSGSGVTCTAYMPQTPYYPVSVATTTLDAATQGTAYDQLILPGGGHAPYTWASSGLPKGLKLNKKTGELTGTPKTPGSPSFSVTVTDSKGTTASQTLSVVVNPSSPVAVKATSIPKATQGKAYSKALASTGGTNPDTWSITGGALPNGLSLSGGGVIAGTPTVSGTFTFTVTVTDSSVSPTTGSRAFSLVVKP